MQHVMRSCEVPHMTASFSWPDLQVLCCLVMADKGLVKLQVVCLLVN